MRRACPSAPIGRSADIRVGQLAIAIGSPLGTYTSTVTTGIISATGRTVQVSAEHRLTNLIQTDAAINPGNSGGPLLDAAGNVIGINTAVERDSTGIGFAIPIDIARPIMQQALAGQELARPYVGIRYESIDAKLKAKDNLSVDHGALIGPSTARRRVRTRRSPRAARRRRPASRTATSSSRSRGRRSTPSTRWTRSSRASLRGSR